ncbi:MAG: hypothetical protein KDD82_26175 [Planctomycetes bacterium]|nr:hypothetical protein [Planctomycetota bacterium]
MNDACTWVAPTPTWRPSAPVALKPALADWDPFAADAPLPLPLPAGLARRFESSCRARGASSREVLAQLVRSFLIRELAEGRTA